MEKKERKRKEVEKEITKIKETEKQQNQRGKEEKV